MVARNRARYLAPIALAAALASTYLIVHSGLTHKHATAQSQHSGRRGAGRGHGSTATVYVVQAGDNLTRIASKTGVALATLEALNPTAAADPNGLQTGQRLRLRR